MIKMLSLTLLVLRSILQEIIDWEGNFLHPDLECQFRILHIIRISITVTYDCEIM